MSLRDRLRGIGKTVVQEAQADKQREAEERVRRHEEAIARRIQKSLERVEEAELENQERLRQEAEKRNQEIRERRAQWQRRNRLGLIDIPYTREHKWHHDYHMKPRQVTVSTAFDAVRQVKLDRQAAGYFGAAYAGTQFAVRIVSQYGAVKHLLLKGGELIGLIDKIDSTSNPKPVAVPAQAVTPTKVKAKRHAVR